MIAVSEHDQIQRLVETLTNCLVDLDVIKADIAGAHLDAALQALRHQFGFSLKSSEPE
jgi:hypothetical protein